MDTISSEVNTFPFIDCASVSDKCELTPGVRKESESLLPDPLDNQKLKIEMCEDGTFQEVCRESKSALLVPIIENVKTEKDEDGVLQINNDCNFAIVKFIKEEDCCGVALTKWITEDEKFCYYPPDKTGDKTDIMLKQEAEPSPDWKLQPITVVQYYATSSEAKQNLKKREETSNLESTSEEEVTKMKRRAKRKKNFPLPGEKNVSSDDEDIHIKKPKTTPTAHPSQSPPYSSLPSVSLTLNLNLPDSTKSSSTNRQYNSSKNLFPAGLLNPLNLNTLSPDLSTSCNQTSQNTSTQSFSDGEKLILEQLGMLHTTVTDLCKKISLINNRTKSLESKIDVLMRTLPPDQFEQENSTPADLNSMLPIKTYSDFEKFDISLQDENVAKQFITLLLNVGGKDFKSNMNNILRRVIICEVGMEFSYSGKSLGTTKLAFANTQVCKCIQYCMQRIYPEEATEASLKVAISHWLQQAKTRVSRRKTQLQEENV